MTFKGAINFIFALPAIRSIDTIGRRSWLLATLPLMAIFMAGAALSFQIKDDNIKVPVLAVFLFSKLSSSVLQKIDC